MERGAINPAPHHRPARMHLRRISNPDPMPRRRIPALLLLAVSLYFAHAAAQQPVSPAQPAAAAPSTPSVSQTGGVIHGSIKSGTIPLPGVSITATNTLTGRKYTTATDAHGNYSMTIPMNGRYVLRTELAAFAPTTQEALLNATSHDQKVDFTLTLASRAAEQENQQQAAATRQYSGRGAQTLSLADAATGLIEAAGGSNGASAALPSLASNPDVSSESVAVAGQNGSTNPFAGINFGDGPPRPEKEAAAVSAAPVAHPEVVLPAAVPAVAALEEEDSAEAEAGAAALAVAATSAISIRTSPTAPSSGPAATPP